MTLQTLSPEHAGAAPLPGLNVGVARIKRSYATPAPVRGTAASNDAAYVPGSDHAAELDSWARRAAAANGFGDVHPDLPTSNPEHDAYRLAVEARAARGASLAERFGALFETVADGARHLRASWSPTTDVRATYRTLREFDTRAPRDLGLDLSEMRSESAGIAVPVRASISFAPGDSPLLYKTEGMRQLAADISQWVAKLARRHVDAWRRRRLAWATYKSLRGLDARTLRDLGLDRSELRSVSAEIAGEADRTRMQALRTLRALSLF